MPYHLQTKCVLRIFRRDPIGFVASSRRTSVRSYAFASSLSVFGYQSLWPGLPQQANRHFMQRSFVLYSPISCLLAGPTRGPRLFRFFSREIYLALFFFLRSAFLSIISLLDFVHFIDNSRVRTCSYTSCMLSGSPVGYFLVLFVFNSDVRSWRLQVDLWKWIWTDLHQFLEFSYVHRSFHFDIH